MDFSNLAKVLRLRADAIDARAEDQRLDQPRDAGDRTDAELIRVLARLLEGKEIHRAFGAPGDWGYSTAVGKALCDAYRG